jgi:hypothetical protein
MPTFTISREARRIVREKQIAEVQASSEEEALEKARSVPDANWEESDFIETWTDSASDFEIDNTWCDDCGNEIEHCVCAKPEAE